MRRTLFLRRAFPPTRPLLNASRAPPPRATPAPTPAAPSRPSLRTTPSGPRPTPVTLNTSPPPSRSTSASHEGDLPQGPIVRRFRTPEQGEKFYRRVRRAAAATHDRDAQMEGLLTYRQDRTIVAIQWVCVVGESWLGLGLGIRFGAAGQLAVGLTRVQGSSLITSYSQIGGKKSTSFLQ